MYVHMHVREDVYTQVTRCKYRHQSRLARSHFSPSCDPGIKLGLLGLAAAALLTEPSHSFYFYFDVFLSGGPCLASEHSCPVDSEGGNWACDSRGELKMDPDTGSRVRQSLLTGTDFFEQGSAS